eukprot:TRINITY_DN4090_c0_g1_i1.p1 TRINITY_DN4090_c0_g1~~TRINITY_DN4090_c0_g1_i1.p1  ORF type:complete len:1356 (+),score=309.88 TRINITY_DN4090_c0_g1_i1:153-4070(+)
MDPATPPPSLSPLDIGATAATAPTTASAQEQGESEEIVAVAPTAAMAMLHRATSVATPSALALPVMLARPSTGGPFSPEQSGEGGSFVASPLVGPNGSPLSLNVTISENQALHSIKQLPLLQPGGKVPVGKLLSRCQEVPSRRPACFAGCGLLLVVAAVVAGLLSFPVQVETNFESFLKADVESAMLRDAFLSAVTAEKRRKASQRRRLEEADGTNASAPTVPRMYTNVDLRIAYELEDTTYRHGAFHPQAVAEVADFELALRKLPGWLALCALTEPGYEHFCAEGVSYTQYFMPTLQKFQKESNAPSEIKLDGRGRETIPIAAALKVIFDADLQEVFFPKEAGSLAELTSDQSEKVLVVSSFFRFRLPREELQSGKWEQFLGDVLIPRLRQGSGTHFKVLFSGTGVETFQAREALWGDMMFAGGSASFVFAYMVFHIKSVLLSFLGLVICVLSVPLAYVILAVLVGSTTVNMASFLALFLVVGFGCDVLFVYTDAWRDSDRFADGDKERVAWTLKRAIKVSFATTATTALSFFANLASAIRALRQFGFFMGLCVVVAWVLISIIYVPLCVWDDRIWSAGVGWWHRRRAALQERLISEPVAEDAEPKAMGYYAQAAAGLKKSWRYFRSRSGHPDLGTRAGRFALWAEVVYRWRWTLLIVSVAATLTAGVFAGINVEPKMGSPSLFPEGHNGARAPEVFATFVDPGPLVAKALPNRVVSVCGSSPDPASLEACALNWCQAKKVRNQGVQPGGNLSCSCYERQLSRCGQANIMRSFALLVEKNLGLEQTPEDASLEAALVEHARARSGSFASPVGGPAKFIFLEEWESGNVSNGALIRAEAGVLQAAGANGCDSTEVCYCSGTSCVMESGPDWKFTGALQVPAAIAQGRRLQVNPIPKANRVKVRLVAGIAFDTSMPLLAGTETLQKWSINEKFNPSSPWSQRYLLQLCSSFADELLIDYKWCWHDSFKKYLRSQQEQFPTSAHRFEGLLASFREQDTAWDQYLWLSEDGKMKALYGSIRVNVHSKSSGEALIAYKALWDKHINDWNKRARAAVGVDAVQISKAWTGPEVQDELISSTVSTLFVLVILAFVGMVVFTRSLRLSLMVVVATCSVVVGLAFFVVNIMRWTVGLIEVVAIIYFVGYAVTYSLHIAHVYAAVDVEASSVLAVHSEAWRTARFEAESSRRFLRVSFALQRIGGAALGSAATTAGSSAFLMLCTLTVFGRLGGMCLAVTVLSIYAALVPLPAALLLMAPSRPGMTTSDALASVAKLFPASARLAPPALPDFGPLNKIQEIFNKHREDHEALRE